jgi:hypothetical protein
MGMGLEIRFRKVLRVSHPMAVSQTMMTAMTSMTLPTPKPFGTGMWMEMDMETQASH